ncbi:unnamed protein product [Pylaiella littoralis]
MFAFLNLSFESFDGTGKGEQQQQETNPWRWESNNSPFTTRTAAVTPTTEPVFTPPSSKKPLENQEARETEICSIEGVKKRQSVRKKRQSSVFFKLPDLENVRTKGGGKDVNPQPPSEAAAAAADRRRRKESVGGGSGRGGGGSKDHHHHRRRGAGTGVGEIGHNLASRFSRPGGSSRRRSRRASVAPELCSPSRTRADRAAAVAAAAAAAEAAAQRDVDIEDERSRELDFGSWTIGVAAAAAAEAAEAAEASIPCFEDMRSDRGTMLVTVGEEGPTPVDDGGSCAVAAAFQPDSPEARPQKKPSPRSSPRALSAGHRRESCRDVGVISRAPKGLSAASLLEDAHDVARIRSQANLRAKMEGVCWVASNWSVGGRKGVLSGKRFLVLCDNIVWAELREADRRASLGEGTAGKQGIRNEGGGGGGGSGSAGFMPIIALEGAIVQHCEVATSNNGWVIEVVNPADDVTLWLDPENPTALLRWGSVLCQALQHTLEGDDE